LSEEAAGAPATERVGAVEWLAEEEEEEEEEVVAGGAACCANEVARAVAGGGRWEREARSEEVPLL
jgi:hypothetical protein